MKKIMLFAVACVAIVACTKNIDKIAPENAAPFEKGQKVTLSVNTDNQTKVSSALNATTGAVDFKWETGDKIKVTVDSESAEFTLKSGAGTSSATFEGTMPADGTTFNVQYPYGGVAESDLTSQTYSSTKSLPKDKMLFKATGCTLSNSGSNSATLTAQYSALRLNLWGLNREVSKIVVTNTTASPNVSYTLNCSNAIRVGNSAATATPFLLVVPAGTSGWKFKVEVTTVNATTNLDAVPTYTEGSYTGDGLVITTGTMFTTASAQTFSAGQILNMPEKLITTVWAPVNCGYHATDYKYGKLYQFGRAVGAKFNSSLNATQASLNDSGTFVQNNKKEYSKNPEDNYFYIGQSNGTATSFDYWYASSQADQLPKWPMKSDDTGYVAGKVDNPCPSGWRVPTYDEFNELRGHYSSWDTKDGLKGRYLSGSDAYSANVTSVFLPAGGDRSQQGCGSRHEWGTYWSSNVDGSMNPYYLLFSSSSSPYFNSKKSSYGRSVRCVLN